MRLWWEYFRKQTVRYMPDCLATVARRFRSRCFRFRATWLTALVRLSGKPVVLRDWAGYSFWQYPGDEIRRNLDRKSVTDAVNIMRYVHETVHPGWVCVDIGANIGAVSIAMWAKAGKTGKVVSVEADPGNIPRLQANLRLNGLPDAYVLGVAVTDKRGTSQLRCFPDANGWQTLGQQTPHREEYVSYLVEVVTVPLTDVLTKYDIGRVDLVKIDVEGAEILVLQSMRQMLQARVVRRVIFEVHEPILRGMGTCVSELMAFWENLDYRLFEVGADGRLLPIPDDGWLIDHLGDCLAIAVDEPLSLPSRVGHPTTVATHVCRSSDHSSNRGD